MNPILLLYSVPVHCILCGVCTQGCFGLSLCVCFLALSVCLAQKAEEDSQERARPDPMVSVGDLEKCIENFFRSTGTRNLQAIMAKINVGITWKSAP